MSFLYRSSATVRRRSLRLRRPSRARRADLRAEIVDLDRLVPAGDDQALDHVLELAHVAGPRVVAQGADGLRRDVLGDVAGCRVAVAVAVAVAVPVGAAAREAAAGSSSTSTGMSSRRSRSGGTIRWMTFRR